MRNREKAASIEAVAARTRGWAPVLDPDSELPFSQADAIAIMTPLVAASTVIQMPQASAKSRARVASGVLFARHVARWGRAWDGDETEEVEHEGESFAVGPEDLGSEAVQLVQVTQDRREVTLSGESFPLPKLDEPTARSMTEGCQRLYAVVATWQSIPAMARWFEADARDLSAKGEAVELPPDLYKRTWWFADDGDTVRAKRNALSLLHRLAKAWAKVEHKAQKAAEGEEKRRASYRAHTATMLAPIARSLHATLTTETKTETVGMLEQIIIEAPGHTRPLASLALEWREPWGGSLADHFVPKPMMAKVYACSLAESWDEGADDLSWIQNHERFAEKYFATVSNRVVGEISDAFADLLRMRVLRAGKFVAPDGVGVPLIDGCAHEDDRKNPRFRHGMIMGAALGKYGADERSKLGLDKQLVQIPRALVRVEHRLFPLGLGGTLLVRDNLEGVRKRGVVALSKEAFFRGLGRVNEARKRGVAGELSIAARVFEQGCIGTAPVLRGDMVEFEPSQLLLTAYAKTMSNAARFEVASAKASVRARRSAKK